MYVNEDGNSDYDRTSVNESDGAIFYGYDDDEGYTWWYDENGNFDTRTDTPEDEDDW